MVKMSKKINKVVYCIVSGSYSSRRKYGYFIKKNDAEKYCALKNHTIRNEYEEYSYEELCDLSGLLDYSCIDSIESGEWVYYEFIFNIDTGYMRRGSGTPYAYKGLKKDDLYEYNVPKPDSAHYQHSSISFSFNCESEPLAKKIAQDKFAEFMSLYRETGSIIDTAKAIGARDGNEVFKEWTTEHWGWHY